MPNQVIDEGSVVLLNTTGQAGTVTEFLTAETIQVLLRSGELWHGPVSAVRLPQSPEELSAAPIEFEKPAPKRTKRKSCSD